MSTNEKLTNALKSLPLADSPELAGALAEANVPTLLAAYVHLSRDTAMLDRFAPHIKPAFSGEPTVIPDDLSEELRAKIPAERIHRRRGPEQGETA